MATLDHPLRAASLVVYSTPGSAPGSALRPGLRVGDTVVDLTAALQRAHGEGWHAADPAAARWLADPARLELFLAVTDWEDRLQSVLPAAHSPASGEAVPLAAVTLHQPLHKPDKIIAVGLNYASHAAEADREISPYPVLFAKYSNTLSGPGEPIPIPRATHRVDYEGELGVVVGRRAKEISRDQADAYVAGYLVSNDVSARDYQFRTKEMLQGKTFDGFCPIGPGISKARPAEQLGDLRLTTRVNGELRQNARLAEMIYDVPTLVEYVSQILTLEPGDLILTGTPSGIGATMSPRRWLRDGDVVVIEIDDVGVLTNPVAGPDGSPW